MISEGLSQPTKQVSLNDMTMHCNAMAMDIFYPLLPNPNYCCIQVFLLLQEMKCSLPHKLSFKMMTLKRRVLMAMIVMMMIRDVLWMIKHRWQRRMFQLLDLMNHYLLFLSHI